MATETATLHLRVRTPQKTLLDVAAAHWVQAPLADGGGIGILPRHAPLLAATAGGPLRYADAVGEHRLDVAAGILRICGVTVTIFTSGLLTETEAAPSAPSAPGDQTFDRLVQELVARRPSRPSTQADASDESA